MAARYVRPCSKGQKNDFSEAEVIAEAILLLIAALESVFRADLQLDRLAVRHSFAAPHLDRRLSPRYYVASLGIKAFLPNKVIHYERASLYPPHAAI